MSDDTTPKNDSENRDADEDSTSRNTEDIRIKPGNVHAMAALRAGREDEYIDRMAWKYGGEW